MVRAMYCEMLGYEASFAYIHAIKLAQQGTVLEKRVGMLHTLISDRMLDQIHIRSYSTACPCFHVIAGYLAVSLFLNESHELLLLLVNTVLKVCMFFHT